LFTSERQLSLSQGDLREGFLNLGLWMRPAGGAFELQVRRPGYGAWITSQIDPTTGATVQRIPGSLVDPTSGLSQFMSLEFLDTRGHVVVRRTYTFCPSGETARVNDTGPANQTYPSGCNPGFGLFPFTRGLVWGIDAGWAVEEVLGSFDGIPGGPFAGPIPIGRPQSCLVKRHFPGAINLAPGNYTVRIGVTPVYRRLFAIPSAGVTLHVRVTHTRIPRRRCVPHPVPVRRRSQLRPAAESAAGGARVASVAQPAPGTMPNLIALPAWGIAVHRERSSSELLTFNATVWNAGPAPFAIEGYRRLGSDVMGAYEYFYDAAGNVVGRARAGTMFYDNGRGHHHWHIRQLASYELVGPSGRVWRSQKQSFCIAPTNAVDLTVPNASLAPATSDDLGFGGSVCDLDDPAAIWLREQLPVGWGDTYQQFVAGQAIDVTDVPNGRYRLEVRVNPLGVLHETTTKDDRAIRTIRLTGPAGKRKVSVAPWHGIKA
jgi:hypothetical protein